MFYLNKYGVSHITLASWTVYFIAARWACTCREGLVSGVFLVYHCTCHSLSCGYSFIHKIFVWWLPACRTLYSSCV